MKPVLTLLGFAGSPRAHYTELLIRSVVGGSFVVYAPRMLLPTTFRLFGWVLLVTTGVLLLLPWRWHHRFAQLVVPQAIRYITLIGWCSLALGVLILAAVFWGMKEPGTYGTESSKDMGNTFTRLTESFQADRDPRERGSRPLNSNR